MYASGPNAPTLINHDLYHHPHCVCVSLWESATPWPSSLSISQIWFVAIIKYRFQHCQFSFCFCCLCWQATTSHLLPRHLSLAHCSFPNVIKKIWMLWCDQTNWLLAVSVSVSGKLLLQLQLQTGLALCLAHINLQILFHGKVSLPLIERRCCWKRINKTNKSTKVSLELSQMQGWKTIQKEAL